MPEKDVRIYIAQANEKVLEQIKKMLSEFEIRCGNGGPYVKKGTETKMYGLMVHGSNQVLSFYEQIGSAHPEKVLRFELLKTAKQGDKDSSVASSRSVWPSEGKVL